MAARLTPTPGVTADGWVSIGVIARPHGIKGALKLHLWHDHTAVLRGGLEILVGGKLKRVTTYAAGILALDGLHDRNISEAMQGQEVMVRRTDFPAEEEGVYLVDLVKAVVVNEAGEKLGVVAGISDNGAQPLLLVHGHGKETMVPFVDAIVLEVTGTGAEGRIVLRPPAGLFDEANALVDDLDDKTQG